MIYRIIGAVSRAFLVIVLVTLPALVVPGIGTDAAQIVLLFALFAGVLTLIEYYARFPSLIEFRFAPPYNRIRFLALFLIVFMSSMVVAGQSNPTALTGLIEAVGALIGEGMDFPYSPVRLVMLMLPDSASVEHLVLVRTIAGISYLVSLFMLVVFVTSLRIGGWPSERRAFNVWVNLPTFDPTRGPDVVTRLERHAFLNLSLGFLLPFLIPALVRLASTLFEPITLEGPQTLIWMMAAWAFLPASLLMRGVAIGRIARMIRHKRESQLAGRDPATLQAV